MRALKDSGIEWIGQILCDWKVQPVRCAFTENKQKNTDGLITNALQFKFGTIIPKKNFEADEDEYVADTITNYTIVEPRMIMINGLNLNYDLKSYRVAIVREKGVITSAYLSLIPDESVINAEFANYLFKGYEAKMAFHNMGAGIRKTLGFKEFKNQPILIPKLSEQEKIVRFLDEKLAEIDNVIAKTQATIEEYKKLKQSVITEAVTKGIRGERPMKDSGVAWIGEIPAEWDISKIKYGVTKVGSGKTPSGGAETYAGEGILFLRSQNIYDTGIVLDPATYITEQVDEEMKNTRVQPHDVLLNITGGSIGRCCVFPESLQRANVNQHVSIIRVDNKVFLPEFIHYYWMSSLGKMSINLLQTGGNREGMSADAIKNSLIPMLSVMEQQEIINYLNAKCREFDKLIESKTHLLTELENYKKSVIYEYVTGKKEVE